MKTHNGQPSLGTSGQVGCQTEPQMLTKVVLVPTPLALRLLSPTTCWSPSKEDSDMSGLVLDLRELPALQTWQHIL